MNINKGDCQWSVHRSPEVRTRSWDSKSPATEYRRMKRRAPSAVNKENSMSRSRRNGREVIMGATESKAG